MKQQLVFKGGGKITTAEYIKDKNMRYGELRFKGGGRIKNVRFIDYSKQEDKDSSGGDSSDSSSGGESKKFVPITNFYNNYITISRNEFGDREKKGNFYIIKLAEDISVYDIGLYIINNYGDIRNCCLGVANIEEADLGEIINTHGSPITDETSSMPQCKGCICFDTKSNNTFLIVDKNIGVNEIYLKGSTNKEFYIKN